MPANTSGNVFITGAAAGIGAATTRQLARAGYAVYAGVHKDIGGLDGVPGVRQVVIDVTDPDSVAAAARQVAAETGDDGLRAIINNAGIIVQGPLELIRPADLERQFGVNTLGPAYIIQAFLPLLRAGHGRVINVSAPTARVPVPFLAPLSASKAALSSLSDAIRLELSAWDIPVVVIEPGGTDTQIFAKADAMARDGMAAADPGRVGLYREQLTAVGKAAANQKLGPVDPVARAIVTAVRVRTPKRFYSVGTGVRLGAVLARLPISVRERAVAGFFGLSKIKAPANAASG